MTAMSFPDNCTEAATVGNWRQTSPANEKRETKVGCSASRGARGRNSAERPSHSHTDTMTPIREPRVAIPQCQVEKAEPRPALPHRLREAASTVERQVGEEGSPGRPAHGPASFLRQNVYGQIKPWAHALRPLAL